MASRSRKNKSPDAATTTEPTAPKVKPVVSGVIAGIEVPPSGRGFAAVYPFDKLQSDGDMFFVQNTTLARMRGTCAQRTKKAKTKGLTHKYVARKLVAQGISGVEDGTEGVGVWLKSA